MDPSLLFEKLVANILMKKCHKTGLLASLLNNLMSYIMTGGDYPDAYICQSSLSYTLEIGEFYCIYLTNSDFQKSKLNIWK